MPRRKRWVRSRGWIGRAASLKSLKRYCREIWSELVKTQDGHQCVLCGEIRYVNAHHLITSKCLLTRYDPSCGLSLCAKHHQLGKISAHCSPWVIYQWLQKNKPEQYTWFLEHQPLIYEDNPSWEEEDYRLILRNLLQKFEKIDPSILKRSKYYKFSELEEEDIIKWYTEHEGESVPSTATQFHCGEMTIKGILRRHGVRIRLNPKKHKMMLA